MATIKDVTDAFLRIAPPTDMEEGEYDNVGLLAGSLSATVTRALCCLDVTSAVIDEAIEKGAELIVAHHPMIYAPIKSVADDSVTGAKLIKAIKNGIAIYAAHTNLDFTPDGINDYAAELLKLSDVEVMCPFGQKGAGLGRVGELPKETTADELRKLCGKAFRDDFVRIIGDKNAAIRRVAVINGAGGGDVKYIDSAIKAGADCLVTADVKHHVAVYAVDRGFTLVEPQHYTMEHVYIEKLAQKLGALLPEVQALVSEKDVIPRV